MPTNTPSVRFKAIGALVLCLALSGCASSFRLPEVSGESFVYSRKDVAGGTVVTAKNVKVTEEMVEAEHVNWSTSYPFMSVSLTVDGFKQKRTAKEKAKTEGVAP